MTVIERVIEIVRREPGITQRAALRRVGASRGTHGVVVAVRAGLLARVKVLDGHALYPVGVDLPPAWTAADTARAKGRRFVAAKRERKRALRRQFEVGEVGAVIERSLFGRGWVPVGVLLSKVRRIVGSGHAVAGQLAGLVRGGLVAVRRRDGVRSVCLVPESERRSACGSPAVDRGDWDQGYVRSSVWGGGAR